MFHMPKTDFGKFQYFRNYDVTNSKFFEKKSTLLLSAFQNPQLEFQKCDQTPNTESLLNFTAFGGKIVKNMHWFGNYGHLNSNKYFEYREKYNSPAEIMKICGRISKIKSSKVCQSKTLKYYYLIFSADFWRIIFNKAYMKHLLSSQVVQPTS